MTAPSILRAGASAGVARLAARQRNRGFTDYQAVLEQAKSCLPVGLTVVLRVDRGFVHAELRQWLRQAHWHYRLRLPRDTLIHLPDRRVVAVAQLCPPKGEALFYPRTAVPGFGHRHTALH